MPRSNFHFEDGAGIVVNPQVDGIVVVDQFHEVRADWDSWYVPVKDISSVLLPSSLGNLELSH